jgi:5'-nucleotidase (lipoprotein e(P4) family)
MSQTSWTTALLVVLAAGAGGCASTTQTVTAPPKLAPSPAPAVSDVLHWVRDSAEYRALALQAYGAATRHVEAAAAGRPAGSWGVVLDADETILDNTQYEKERGELEHDEGIWNQWVERRAAVPVPGARAFLQRVRDLGGRIAIVTNRADSVCDATRDNLRQQGLLFDVALCKPEGVSDKNPRFEAVAAGTAGMPAVEVVAFVGDNIKDFPKMGQELLQSPDEAFAPFGQRYFIIPNPLYGSWEKNPYR